MTDDSTPLSFPFSSCKRVGHSKVQKNTVYWQMTLWLGESQFAIPRLGKEIRYNFVLFADEPKYPLDAVEIAETAQNESTFFLM